MLSKVFSDASLNSDSTITISTEEGLAIFENTGKYQYRTEIIADGCKGGARSTYGKPLISSTYSLDGDLEINVGVDYPLMVVEKKDNSEIIIIIAPRVEDK